MFLLGTFLRRIQGFVLVASLALLAGCVPQPVPLPAAAPASIDAIGGNAVVNLTWAESAGATRYSVRRSVVSGGPYTQVGTSTTTTYADSAVTNGTTYYYVVAAINEGGTGANSAEISATPAVPTIPLAPTALVATAGDGQISLTWTASSGATGYRVKRATVSGGPYTQIAAPTAASYVDTPLTNGTDYYYVVSATNVVGESPNSTQVVGTPSPPPPATFGTWVDVTPGNVNLTGPLSCGNAGTSRIQADPANPADLYVQFSCQGIWKSTNHGLTWTGPINTGTNGAQAGDCAGGIAVARTSMTGPPVIYQSCIRGNVSFWRSLDGGVNWTSYPIAATARQDYFPPVVDPHDPTHLLMAGHEHPAMVESVDGGQNWTAPVLNPAMTLNLFSSEVQFVNTGNPATTRGTWIWTHQGASGAGTWRTANGGSSWVRVENSELPFGTSQFIYQPNTSGVVFLAGNFSTLGAGVLRSTDYGQTWAHVGNIKPQGLVVGTSKNLYSFGNQNAGFQVASLPGTGTWVEPALPAVLLSDGALQIAVVNDGSSNILVGAMGIRGVWRYVEP